MKLVRDLIPDIIKKTGKTPICHIATTEEYKKFLNLKLLEEVKELIESSQSIEELVDIAKFLRNG